jgi:hypothetical protein
MSKKKDTAAAAELPEALADKQSLSDIIREVIAENPDMKPAAIVAHLASKGITVKVGLVNAVRSKAKGSTTKKGKEEMVSMVALQKVKALVAEYGSDQIETIVSALK